MDEKLGAGQIKLRVIGLPAMNDRVLAKVFARKLTSLIKAVEAADKAANGRARYDYVIVDLKPTSASVTVEEQRTVQEIPESSVAVLGDCVNAVNDGRFNAARAFPGCVTHLHQLAKDVGEKFSRAELTINGFQPVIVDRIFLDHAAIASRPAASESAAPEWFKGTAIGDFEGKILEIDLRGNVPTGILRLTAGGREIPCEFPSLDGDKITQFMEQRVRVVGDALYDGRSGFPVRLRIRDEPRILKPNADIFRWKGAFEKFDLGDWDGA